MALPAEKIKHPYITCKEGVCGGEPIIEGTRTPVRSIVVYRLRLGDSVEEIARQLPHLSPAQVYDALSYYYDHRDEIDRLIEENTEERLMRKYPPTYPQSR